MKEAGDASTPCRPRSARYAEKGYPNYAEVDGRSALPHRRNSGGDRAEGPSARIGGKRGRKKAVEASENFLVPVLQGEEAVEQEGRKRLGTDAASTATVADKISPLIGDAEEDRVDPNDGGGGEPSEVGGVCKSWRLRVKETLRAFSTYHLRFEQEEQRREEAFKQKQSRDRKCQKGKSQDNEGYQEGKRPSKRPDLKALTEMQKSGSVLFPEKQIGHIPGIDVGDQFCSRAEMVVLGIHSHWMNGIDYMGAKYRDKKGYENFTFPLATCIVMSGMYEDLDKADEIIYTGEGGNNRLGDCHQNTEQKMLRGNLALKNSINNGNPIRVIRGHKAQSSNTGKIYTYDGLYKVMGYWPEQDVPGQLVFKYTLRRLEGQPPLTTALVLFTRKDAPMPISELPGLVCEDISNGQENIQIPATNLVDKPALPPSGFVYSKSMHIPKDIEIPVDRIGCSCTGDCSSSMDCLCAKLNGSDLPYVFTEKKRGVHNDSNTVGRLIKPKGIVFECGATCSCHCSCVNRTSQQGLKHRLEVFKTKSKGWGVRTWDTILPGALICEYTGVLRRTAEVEGLLENNYIFDIDCLQTIKGLDGREVLKALFLSADHPHD